MILRTALGITVVFSLVLANVAACSGGADGTVVSDEQTPDTRTIVHVHADGTKTVTAEPIETGVRALNGGTGGTGGIGGFDAGVHIDPACSGADLQMFSQTSFRGSELCVYYGHVAPNSLDLTQVLLSHFCKGGTCYNVYWAGAIRSFSSNAESGYFESPTTAPYESYFRTSYAQDVADAVTQSATLLYITD